MVFMFVSYDKIWADDDCLCRFVSFYCRLYYKKYTKTTYTEVNSHSIFLFYAVKIYGKVM